MKPIITYIAVPSALVAVLFVACSSSSATGFAGSDAGGTTADSGGGGSTDSGGIAPSGDVTKACADSAAAFCAQIQSCSPFGLQATFGDIATCQTRFALGCVQTLAFAGTTATIASTEACASALPAVSCSDFIAGRFGDACSTKPGALADGANCGDDAQCTSTFCARAPYSQCGVCSPLSTAGAPCVNQACSTGFACPTGQSTCIVPVAGQVGDTCHSQNECDVAHAVGCNTGNTTCLKLEVASSGGSCGADSISPSKFTVCPAGGSCDAVLNGSCHAAAADGAACSTASTGPSCLSPARCVASICTLPDANSCH